MATINKIGLEAEFFLRNKDGELLFPRENGFSTDDFVILGEFRASPGTSREETIANFMKSWYEVIFKARKGGFSIDVDRGYSEVSPEFYSEIMKKMGTKSIATCENIYPNIDILKLSDAVVKKGVIEKYYISSGLHIHFSSTSEDTKIYREVNDNYSQINIPFNFGNTAVGGMTFYQKGERKETEHLVKASVNRITKPVISHIVKKLDDELFNKFQPDVPLKYRNPGFYEIKSYGFEYRSLPFSNNVLSHVGNIVDFSYSLLEDLDI